MGDAVIMTPCIPSTCTQNAIFSLLFIYIIPSGKFNLGIDNLLLLPSISCRNTSRYFWKYTHAAENVSHGDILQSDGCHCISHMNKF